MPRARNVQRRHWQLTRLFGPHLNHAQRRGGLVACWRSLRPPAGDQGAQPEIIMNFSPTKFAFSSISLLFSQVGSLFRQVGSLIRQSLCSQVSCSPLESRPSDRTASFCLRKLKLLSLSAAGTQRMVDTCRSEQRRYKFSHCTLFKLLTGGSATAGTGGRHVSHGIESQRVTNSGPKPETLV